MLPNAVPLSFNIAGKVFLLGEYAVIAGRPAIVAAVSPRFRLSVGRDRAETIFHLESPASRLVRESGVSLPPLHFEDPHEGRGGFGASTAQFALVYSALSRVSPGAFNWDWKSAWKLYRKLMKDSVLIPSGADLVAQWQGGVVFFDPSQERCESPWRFFDWSRLLVFSASGQAGRKIATHEHLSALAKEGFPLRHEKLITSLERMTAAGAHALRENDVLALGLALDEYAETLSRADLELSATRADREALRDLPGVCGVKGTGALQADGVLVLLEPDTSDRSRIIQAATSRGLVLIADGLK